MVFLQFPSSLTEEELMLQNKYAKLKKMRKKLAALKNPDKSDLGKPGDVKSASSSSAGGGLGSKKVGSSSSAVPEAKDAKEVARKLIRTGAIAAIQKSVEKDRAAEKKAGFKRSQGLERKLTGMDAVARAGYQPFSATHGPGGGFDTGGEDMNPDPPEPVPPAKKVKNLYDSFVSARDREERGLADRESGLKPDRQRRGNTVYVFGYNITEDLLRGTFSSGDRGKIVNISMEVEKVKKKTPSFPAYFYRFLFGCISRRTAVS